MKKSQLKQIIKEVLKEINSNEPSLGYYFLPKGERNFGLPLCSACGHEAIFHEEHGCRSCKTTNKCKTYQHPNPKK